MLHLKCFFRKKSTVIYLCIYSIIVTTIICSFSLIEYSKNVINHIYKKESFLVMTSTDNYYNKIIENKDIEKVEKIIVFNPNYDDKTFKRESYSVVSNNSPTISYNNGEEYEKIITWEDYITIPKDKEIMVTSDIDKDFKLQNNEIALSMQGIKYKDQEEMEKYIDKDLSIMYCNNVIQFKIRNYYDSKHKEMVISENKFNELISKSNVYSYKIYLKNYLKSEKVIDDLKKINNENNIKINEHIDFDASINYDSYSIANNLIYIFEIINNFIIFVFIIIFIIVSKNLLEDEKKNIIIQKMLGYNKFQSKKYFIFKIISLYLLVFGISIIVSSIINVIINNILLLE